ncbi:MAG: protein kinase [Planctomycetota bacterium]
MSDGALVDDGHVPAPERDDPWLGRELAGRYRVERELGWGSLGRVFEVSDRLAPELGPLALKAVRRDRLGPSARAYLEHEFRWLFRLRHPHVVAAHRFDEEDGVPFFVLDRIAGETIAAAGQRRGWEATVELLAQALRALAYVHQRGLLHMDMKPQNLLVEGDHLRLIDLHLSRPHDAAGDGAMRGTIAYMAPEVVRGREVDQRADLYGLGAVAYQALCGKAPFAEARSPMDVLRAHAQRAPQLFAARGVDVPEPLEDWVRTLLEKRPEHRFPDAHEALRALGVAVARELPLETPATKQAYLLRAPLVERERALSAALSAAEELREGRAAAVALVGEEGIGKTRLLDELEAELALRGVVSLRVRPEGPGGGGSAEALEALEGLLRRAGVAELAPLTREGRLDMDAIALARGGGDPTLPALVRRVSALMDVLREVAAERPLALLVDELERVSPTIVAAATELIEALGWRPDANAVAPQAEGAGAAEAVLLSAEAQRRRDPEGARTRPERDSDSDSDSDSASDSVSDSVSDSDSDSDSVSVSVSVSASVSASVSDSDSDSDSDSVSDSQTPPRSHGAISAISAISALSTNAVAGPHEPRPGASSRESPDSGSDSAPETAGPRADGSAAIAAGAARALDISAEIAESAEIARRVRGRISAADSDRGAGTGTGTGTGTKSLKSSRGRAMTSDSASNSGAVSDTGPIPDSLPVLLVLTSRDRAALPGGEGLAVHELGRLTRPGAAALVGALLEPPRGEAAPALVERLWEVTGGNPRYLEQTLRELLEAGGLVDLEGRPAARAEDAERVLPSANLGELTAARVGRLSEDARALLAGLATGAQAATLRFAGAVAELPPERAEAALADLLRRGFVRPLATLAGPLALEHAPLSRAVEAACGEERMRALHARALRLIESRHPATWREGSGEVARLPERAADRSEELLWHAERAQAWGQALRYARQAADAAAREEDHQRARDLYERALGLVERLRAEGAAPAGEHLALTLALARALAATGARPRALELLRPLDAPFPRSPAGLRLRARLRKDAGEFAGARADLERALEMAEESADLGEAEGEVERARARAELASVLLWEGDYAAARHEGERALRALEALGGVPSGEGPVEEPVEDPRAEAPPAEVLDRETVVALRGDVVAVQDVLYHACHFQGLGDEATGYLQRGLEVRLAAPPRTRQQDPPPQEATAALRRALKRGKVPLLGDAAGAQVPRSIVEAAFERADRADELLQLHLRRSRLLEAAGDLDGAAYAELNLAHLRRARGRLDEARERYVRAAELFARTGCQVGEALVALSAARLRAQIGLGAEAAAAAARARELGQAMGARWIEAQARLAEAEAALCAGDLPAAREALSGARALADELGNRPQQVDQALFAAELALAQDDAATAQSELERYEAAPASARSLTHALRAEELRARLALLAGDERERRLAEERAGEALSEAEERGLVDLGWRLAWRRAQLRRARGWTEGELDDVISALSILRQLGSPLGEAWRAAYLARPEQAALRTRFQALRE